ncbi:hypothetical protein ACFLVX_01185 [Chloroflexota bacterium]
MKVTGALFGVLVGISAGIIAVSPASATPAEGFDKEGEAVFDKPWHVCRTRASGTEGFFQISEESFRPVIAFESLGDDADRAYRLGQQFANKYPDRGQRAEKLFYFVRDKVQYMPDIDQFQLQEFAQNADELAMTIEQQGAAQGDCEDSAILLAVMYKGAGYRSAIALTTRHTAALVYLPEHKKTNLLELDNEPGWVWAEATGRNNPFGWVPDLYKGAKLAAYEISDEELVSGKPPSEPKTAVVKTGGNVPLLTSPFFIVICLMWVISMFRRRRR